MKSHSNQRNINPPAEYKNVGDNLLKFVAVEEY